MWDAQLMQKIWPQMRPGRAGVWEGGKEGIERQPLDLKGGRDEGEDAQWCLRRKVVNVDWHWKHSLADSSLIQYVLERPCERALWMSADLVLERAHRKEKGRRTSPRSRRMSSYAVGLERYPPPVPALTTDRASSSSSEPPAAPPPAAPPPTTLRPRLKPGNDAPRFGIDRRRLRTSPPAALPPALDAAWNGGPGASEPLAQPDPAPSPPAPAPPPPPAAK